MSRGRRISRGPGAALLVIATVACASEDPGGEFTSGTPGVLTVATNLPAPGFWEGPASSPTGGFEYELAVELADRFDLERVVIVDLAFTDLVRGDLGGADIALAQITPTDERDDHLDFSRPYLEANPAVLVAGDRDIADLAAARDLRWVAQLATTAEDVVEEVIRPENEPLLVERIDQVLDAVRTGSADAGLLDLPVALVAAARSGGELEVVAQFATSAGLAVAVPEGSDDLEALDSAVRAMHRDGTLDDLTARWLSEDAEDGVVHIPVIRTRNID